MAVIPSQATPELTEFTDCWACGRRVGWIRLEQDRWRLVDPEPRSGAQYALLRDGVSAMDMHDRRRINEASDLIYSDGPRFGDHKHSCPLPSLRTLGWSAGSAPGGRRSRPDPSREARREALLRADQLRDLGGDSSAGRG